jgi:glycosyltransferase involved in cell wall biosynthesis
MDDAGDRWLPRAETANVHMSAATRTARGSVYFCFADPVGFSGQKAATELVIRGLEARGWNCRRLPQPVLERSTGGIGATWRYAATLLASWLRCVRLLFARGAWLCVNLGQTRAAFVRDAVPLLLGRLGLGRRRIIVSLHGSLFMQWREGSLEVRAFCFLLAQAGLITVLGERQRARLLELGLPGERVVVLVNSCELEPIARDAVIAKHRAGAEPIRCLYLSSLIDTKGFPEYLEALRLVAAQPGPRVDAVLCGRLVTSDFSGRFATVAAAEQWIERELAGINAETRVRVRWVKGAMGADKAELFRTADLFVLPTQYAVEAQPLVLLEAMASGCAIVTTRIGEIATILDERSACFVPEVSAAAVAKALQRLIGGPETRRDLATIAHARFCERYGREQHLDAWERFLTSKPGSESARS